jgi:hypothetical protein
MLVIRRPSDSDWPLTSALRACFLRENCFFVFWIDLYFMVSCRFSALILIAVFNLHNLCNMLE